MDEDRLKHSLAVANKMVELNNGLDKESVFLIGYLHDIGYEFTSNNIEHNKVGGEILKILGFKYWKEIYYHGENNIEYKSDYLDLLNKADMQIDKYGNDVGYDKRLEDIKKRYGVESIEYKKAKTLIDNLKRNIKI